VREIMDDPHFQARGMFESVPIGTRNLKIPAISPRLCDTPGRTDFAGPELGAHNDEVFRDVLRLTTLQIQQLNESGIV
jgi:crotonobetainyl-CoA:carnitine CoA-transferase CaiB-like acyl-CoA transferase